MSLPFKIKKILEKIKDFETKTSNKIDSTQLFSGDMNDLKTPGFYFVDASAITNTPRTGYAYYIVVNGKYNYILQQATRATSADSGLELFQRQYFEGKWTAWQEV